MKSSFLFLTFSIFFISCGNKVSATGLTNLFFLTSLRLYPVSSNNSLIVEALNLTESDSKLFKLKISKLLKKDLLAGN